MAPTTPHDAKGCLIAAIRDDNPVIMIEHRMLHNVRGVVPEESYEIPYGKARVLSPGKDVTIVGISHMALECVRAKHLLEAAGIDAEVIDPVSLSPLDIETIAASVERTGRLLVVDTGWLSCGASSEILAEVFERIGAAPAFRRHAAGLSADAVPDDQDPRESVLSVAAVDRRRHLSAGSRRRRAGLAAGHGRQQRSRRIPRPVLSSFKHPRS